MKGTVHCRTGSLESVEQSRRNAGLVHCRTGSLEKAFLPGA